VAPNVCGESFHTSWLAMLFPGWSTRFVPPTLVTYGDVAGILVASSPSAVCPSVHMLEP
jgi:hypothetical protein